MIFKRSQRRLFECAVAMALVSGAPAFAKPAEQPANAADKPTAAKPAVDKKAAKPKAVDPKTTKAKPVKPTPKAAAPKPFPGKVLGQRAPLPRARPIIVASAVPMVPARASLAPTLILPSTGFLPIRPAAAAPSKPEPAAPPAVYTPASVPTRIAALPASPFVAAESPATPAADVALVKQSIDLVRRGKTSDATALQKTIGDPLARKLVEWTILRSDDSDAGFNRIAAFSSENPSWPNATMMRRRAESALWDDKRDNATVLGFFDDTKPITAKGKFALARALLAQGDRTGAAKLAREAWREDTCSASVERMVMETLGELLTRADHKARMDRRLYDDDSDAGMRMAQLLGGADLAIAKARKAVTDKASNARALLDAVPESARHDASYIFSKVQWLRREDKAVEAAQLLSAAPKNPAQLGDLNEWWTERRLVARKLLDLDEHQAAYRVAREALPPTKENPRAEHEFTAGWIALRFLNNPSAAYQHFSRVGNGTSNPITLARGEYWQGRAAEAAGRSGEARAHYQAAANYPTAYYGQIARAKLGLGEFAVRRPPALTNRAALMNLEVVRAAQILYAIDARDLVIPFVSDLAERAVDIGALVVIAEIAKKYDDARAMLLIGKAALNRGFAFDVYAFPTNGIPDFRIVGPTVDKSVVYSIARQESAFNPRAVSSANALGLMQVLPGTGKQIAKKFGFAFDRNRMLSDASYNAQMGAAELGDVLESYRGSYILSFVAYNAGRGRVKQWIERYGDPRDPNIDPIDWVERIPFSETRNYVQRVLENMQVYRAQLGHGSRLMIEADLRRGSTAN